MNVRFATKVTLVRQTAVAKSGACHPSKFWGKTSAEKAGAVRRHLRLSSWRSSKDG